MTWRDFIAAYAGALGVLAVALGIYEAWHDGYRHGSSDAYALVERVLIPKAHGPEPQPQ